MKRYIHFNINEDEVLFKDRIYINIELDIDELVNIASSTHLELVRFPGVEQFRKDVLAILQEYKFDVIEDIYDGVKQKGHISNRDDSISLYFDTYYDLSNAGYVAKQMGATSWKIPENGLVYCFIHIRISDHWPPDQGDISHRRFVRDNVHRYTDSNPKVTYKFPDEEIVLEEEQIQLYYKFALNTLRTEINAKVYTWLTKSKFYISE